MKGFYGALRVSLVCTAVCLTPLTGNADSRIRILPLPLDPEAPTCERREQDLERDIENHEKRCLSPKGDFCSKHISYFECVESGGDEHACAVLAKAANSTSRMCELLYNSIFEQFYNYQHYCLASAIVDPLGLPHQSTIDVERCANF
jgi:hypothetical protein